MNNNDNKTRYENILRRLGAIQNALVFMCSSGSGAESCSADAKRCGQDVVEERSREGSRVSPGEAKAMERYCREVAANNEAIALRYEKQDLRNAAAFYLGIAAGWNSAAVVLPYFHERAEAGQQCSEGASGRRNVNVEGPAGSATPQPDQTL